MPTRLGGNTNTSSRQVIDIDERNDTVHDKSEMERILERGRRLQ